MILEPIIIIATDKKVRNHRQKTSAMELTTVYNWKSMEGGDRRTSCPSAKNSKRPTPIKNGPHTRIDKLSESKYWLIDEEKGDKTSIVDLLAKMQGQHQGLLGN